MMQAERTTTRLMRYILAILLMYYIATILLVRSSSIPAQPPSRRARGCDILHGQDYAIFYDILHDILRAAAQHVYVCNRGDTRRYSCMHIHNKCTKIFECIDGVYMHCLRRGGSSPPRPRRPRLPDDSVYILLYGPIIFE